jgi:hypothetical protein
MTCASQEEIKNVIQNKISSRVEELQNEISAIRYSHTQFEKKTADKLQNS